MYNKSNQYQKSRIQWNKLLELNVLREKYRKDLEKRKQQIKYWTSSHPQSIFLQCHQNRNCFCMEWWKIANQSLVIWFQQNDFLMTVNQTGKLENLKYKYCVMFQDKTCSSFAQGSKNYGKSAVIDPLRSEKQDPKYVYRVV